MRKRSRRISFIITPILVCIGVVLMNDLYASEENVWQEASVGGFGIYLTIFAAILLTFLTYYGITVLARFIRETTGDSFQGFEDSDG